MMRRGAGSSFGSSAAAQQCRPLHPRAKFWRKCSPMQPLAPGGGVFKTAALGHYATPPGTETAVSVHQRTPAFATVHAIGTTDWHHAWRKSLTRRTAFARREPSVMGVLGLPTGPPPISSRGTVTEVVRAWLGERACQAVGPKPFAALRARSRTDGLVQAGFILRLFIVMSVNPGSRITGMKSFSATQEQALRELVQDALIDFGYGPRSTKNPPRQVERQPAPIVQIAPTRVWPDSDEVLLTEARVCRALGIGRTTLYALIRAKRLKTVRPGRKPMFKGEDVFAFIDALEEEAA
jgi:excisionase family DNA binding protein